jgi:hypothetical protein
MAGEGNGDHYVTRHEWDAHMSEFHEVRKTVRRLESRFDRYAGPLVLLLIALGAIGTAASIYGAVIATP